MITKEQVMAVLVSLEIDSQRSLFILLGNDGLVNRQGYGTVDCAEQDLYIGKATEPLFEQFMSKVSNEIFEHTGVYDIPEQRGKKCKLTLLFNTETGDDGFEFLYGTESQGPPGEIRELVSEAVRLTDGWFQQQKAMVQESQTQSQGKVDKPKWKFWK